MAVPRNASRYIAQRRRAIALSSRTSVTRRAPISTDGPRRPERANAHAASCSTIAKPGDRTTSGRGTQRGTRIVERLVDLACQFRQFERPVARWNGAAAAETQAGNADAVMPPDLRISVIM